MRLTDDPDKVCKCGHAIWYHGGKCTFKGCICFKFKEYVEPMKKNSAGHFLSGFTYTEDQVCKCKHGSWDHFSPKGKKVGRCKHYVQNNKKQWVLCSCKKFNSKVKVKKTKEVKKWPTKRSSKSVRRVKKR